MHMHYMQAQLLALKTAYGPAVHLKKATSSSSLLATATFTVSLPPAAAPYDVHAVKVHLVSGMLPVPTSFRQTHSTVTC